MCLLCLEAETLGEWRRTICCILLTTYYILKMQVNYRLQTCIFQRWVDPDDVIRPEQIMMKICHWTKERHLLLDSNCIYTCKTTVFALG